METLQGAVTEEAIKNLRNFAAEIFESHFVRDSTVRDNVCRQLLADAAFLEFVPDRFDFGELLNNGGVVSRSQDPQEAKKADISVHVALTGAQRAVLVNNNMDFNILFKDAVTAPHALAYAQRVIDTARCKSAVTYRRGPVIDIGGNYATHAATGAVQIHSCTLRDDVEEYHRQTQRDVVLEMADYQEPSMCTNGVHKCDVFASEGFSLHTLPRIDPRTVPAMFRQHGFEFITGVHHYDAHMDVGLSGYMPDVEMHWRVNGPNVDFFFEGDSSYGYSHRLDWLKQYSHNNFFSDTHSSFIVFYSVDRLLNGMVYWTMTRLEKQTLGSQVVQPQYRYVDSERCLTIEVPVFDSTSNFANSDPRAYKLESTVVPMELFSYVYKAGISNDTTRPDLPLSLDQVRDYAHTFNYTRRVNGTAVTVDYRLSSEHIDKIARGVYLVIVQRAAQLKASTTEYTQMFIRIQKRWGDENFLYLVSKCFSSVALMPFFLLADNFQQTVDLMAVHMRSVVKASKVLAAVTQELPYHVISPVQMVSGQASVEFSLRKDDASSIETSQPPEIDVEQFYAAFKEELPQEHRDILRERIEKSQEKAREQVAEAIAVDTFPEIGDTRESWEEGAAYLANNVPIALGVPLRVGTRDEVMNDVHLRIYEAALYNTDVALGVIAAAKDRCGESWTGTGYRQAQITSRNNTTDLGIRFLRVIDGRVQPGQNAEEYSVALDPNTNELLYMPKDDPGGMILPTEAEYVFVFDPFKVFLGLNLTTKMARMLKNLRAPRSCQYTLVDGVPGCGKTHEIVSRFLPNDLVACAVKETANNTRVRILNEHPGAKDFRIRTVDSCILNDTPGAKTLFVDEGLMLLPGAVDYVAQASRCGRVEVFGDSAQIGFIDRGSKLGLLRFEKLCVWEAIEYRNQSVRVPADICFIMRLFYPEWRRANIKTQSPVRRSVQVSYEPNLMSPLYTVAEPNVMLMTVRVSDKDKIASGTGFINAKHISSSNSAINKCTVLTVHEAQGTDVQHATLARQCVFDNPIYRSRPHMLVGLTRHTHTLRVVTAVPINEDEVSRLAERAMQATEEELDDCQAPTPGWLQDKINKARQRGALINQRVEDIAQNDE